MTTDTRIAHGHGSHAVPLPMTPAPHASAPMVAVAGVVALAVSLGIGRFAFTPVLPMMLHDGALTLDQGSWLATLNYIGYFIGAALCLFIRPDAARMVRLALAATVMLTLAMAAPGGVVAWSVWRGVAGLISAVGMVYTAAWCAHRLAELGAPRLGGFIFMGPGLGIVTTGLAAFGMVAAGWHASWSWTAFGLLAAVLTAAVWHVLRPGSHQGTGASAGASAGSAHEGAPVGGAEARPQLTGETWALTAAYGLAGFGYIITATFLPVIARQAMPGSVWADLFWPVFGAGVAIGAALATRIGTHHDNRRLLTHAYLMQAVGVGIAAAWPTVTGFAVSSLLAGLPFTALTAFAVREARHQWGAQAARLIGLMTASYGLGQIVGPPLATALVARTGGFAASLVCASVALVVGALMFVWVERVYPRSQA